MMEYVMEHWLTLGTAVFLLAMTLYGHYRGFLRIALTMSALFISLLFVHVAAPRATAFLKENTQIRAMIQENLMKAVAPESSVEDSQAEGVLPARQRMLIEQMKLPRQVKNALLENNNTEIYRILGVNTFLEYVGAYLADVILSLIGSVVLFILSYLGLRVLMRALDLVARLPILSGMNQIAGAVAGLVQGLLWVWLMLLLTDFFSGTAWAQAIAAQINGSLFLSLLSENNLFDWIFVGLLRNVM